MMTKPRKTKRGQGEVRCEVTADEIAVRAYEIYLSGHGGDDLDNWLRAERELQTARRAHPHGDTGSDG
jgi:hypothetical protein